jgi:hypothetical protein
VASSQAQAIETAQLMVTKFKIGTQGGLRQVDIDALQYTAEQI